MTIIEQDEEVLIECVMLPRKTYNPKLNPTKKKHKMTKAAWKWRLEFSESWDTKLSSFLPIYSLKKKKIKLGKGLAKQILK